MDLVTKTIRDTTGLTLVEFCEKYLHTDSRSFSVRLKKNRLYPNEASLICLMSGKKPIEVFELSTLETFFIKGKSKEVSAQVKTLLDNAAVEILAPDLNEKPRPEKKKVKFRSKVTEKKKTLPKLRKSKKNR